MSDIVLSPLFMSNIDNEQKEMFKSNNNQRDELYK